MGYLQAERNDMFLSYQRVANESHERWVDQFRHELGKKLHELLGGQVDIFVDTAQIVAGDAWRPVTLQSIDRAAIFLAVVSRSYYTAPECLKELDHFLGRLKDPDDGIPRQLVSVFKQPPIHVPSELDAFHNPIAFYGMSDASSAQFDEFVPDRDPAKGSLFYEKLSQLAQDLTIQLERVKQRTAMLRPSAGKIFLATVAPELNQQRDRLRAEFIQRGYTVVPQYGYLWNLDGHEARLLEDLDGACLSVHLIAKTASLEPASVAQSKRQLELAHRTMTTRGVPRPMVWIAAAQEVHESKRDLVRYVTHDLADHGVAYLETTLEDFKMELLELLPKPVDVAPVAASGAKPVVAPIDGSGVARVALLAEHGDIAALGALRALLADELLIDAVRVTLVGAAPKDPDRLRQALADCDRCLLFWGARDEDWLRDVLALPALAARLDRGRLAIYVDAPDTDEKLVFRTPCATTIPARGAASMLRAFVDASLAAS